VVVLAVLAAGVFLIFQNAQAVVLGEFSPAPGSLLKSRPVSVSYELERYVPGKGAVTLVVDGQTVPAGELALRPGLMQARVTLPDGEHTVRLEYDSGNLFSRHLERTWTFAVDTTPPAVTVTKPASFPLLSARGNELALELSEDALVTLTVDGETQHVDPAGSPSEPRKARLSIDEGEHTMVLKATDEAGNVTTKEWDLLADYEAPSVTVKGVSDDEVWHERNSAAGSFAITDFFPDKLKLTASLDGVALALEEGQAESTIQRVFTFNTGALAEGSHDVALSVTDLGGHETTWKRSFLVDTSSVFGERSLKAGAIGADVKQLQRILKLKGVYDGSPTGDFDEATAAAVAAYNAQQALDGGPVVTAETLDHLLGSIRVDISERTLYLYGGGEEPVKTYRVAVGMPAYPTPTGDFRIINKEVDPTWNPPDSRWAAGMGPVPPGPGNPLGTRWMGLNSPGIGIHGTYANSSIGTAASHGCIRMYVHEAEDLFARVFVGTPVKIVE
jgi:lipoprotein-anchoring transpeptidase ErfK/SrfK